MLKFNENLLHLYFLFSGKTGYFAKETIFCLAVEKLKTLIRDTSFSNNST